MHLFNLKRAEKGQVSIELMVIIAAVMVVFIPLLLHVYFKTNEANEQLAQIQGELLTSRMAGLINAVGNLGQNSSLISEFFIPSNVRRIEIKPIGTGGEVIISIATIGGDSELVDIAKFPVEPLVIDSPFSGLRRFRIAYSGDKVTVSPA